MEHRCVGHLDPFYAQRLLHKTCKTTYDSLVELDVDFPIGHVAKHLSQKLLSLERLRYVAVLVYEVSILGKLCFGHTPAQSRSQTNHSFATVYPILEHLTVDRLVESLVVCCICLESRSVQYYSTAVLRYVHTSRELDFARRYLPCLRHFSLKSFLAVDQDDLCVRVVCLDCFSHVERPDDAVTNLFCCSKPSALDSLGQKAR